MGKARTSPTQGTQGLLTQRPAGGLCRPGSCPQAQMLLLCSGVTNEQRQQVPGPEKQRAEAARDRQVAPVRSWPLAEAPEASPRAGSRFARVLGARVAFWGGREGGGRGWSR